MLPKAHFSQDLTWSWASSTGHQTSDQRLDAAAKAAWPYAVLCASTYLNDRDAAHDLMDQAVENTSKYAVRWPDTPANKLTWRIKSMIKRRARQQAAKTRLEVAYGSLSDLESVVIVAPEAEQRAYANELFSRLSPFAQSIVKWRWLGYSWREIAKHSEMDDTTIRRAYLREIASILGARSQHGDSSECG